MRSWVVTENGNPSDVLQIREVLKPSLETGQVLIEVKAMALNFLISCCVKESINQSHRCRLHRVLKLPELSGRLVRGVHMLLGNGYLPGLSSCWRTFRMGSCFRRIRFSDT